MGLKIDNELRDLIPPLADDELKQLENNLINEGWRNNERILTWDGTIVDGHNRYSICQKKNIKFLLEEKKFKDKNEVILWMIDNQLGRRNLPDYARGELVFKKKDILKPIAESNIKGGTLLSIDKRVNITKEVSEETGMGLVTSSRIKFIRDNAPEEIKTKLRSGNKDLSINKVYTDLKKKKNKEDIEKAFRDTPILEKKDRKYQIIYADPPWKYFAGGNKNATGHYHCMDMDKIKELPVKDLADKDCILFLWITFPILKECFEVIESWGFEYKTVGFTWVKKNKKSDGWFFGLGNWTRANAELCLIATKGSPKRKSASISQIIDTPLEEHSKKPDCVREKIVELVGDLPRIELFARQKVKGWDVWGNEVQKEGNKE